MPVAALLFFLSGFLIHWLPDWKHVHLPVFIIYLLFVFAEGIKYSKKLIEFPGVILALVIGNLAPAIGTIAKFARVLPNRKKIYKNT